MSNRQFIHVFQFVAEADPPGDRRDFHLRVLAQPVEQIEQGCFAFDRGRDGEDHFPDCPLGDPLDQQVDLQVRGRDALHRRDHPAQHMGHAPVLARILDRKHMKRSNESFRTLLEDASREVCDETIEKLKSTHNYFADIDYIVATGGTYDAWSEQFNNVFRYMDGLQIIPGNINDPDLSNIYSNVRGYYYQRVNQIR